LLPNTFSKAYMQNIVKRTFSEKFERALAVLEEAAKPQAHIVTRPIEEKYLRHAFTSRFMKRPDVAVRRMELPSCPRCEKAAFRDRLPGDPPAYMEEDNYGVMVRRGIYVTCPECHYHGPPGPPIYKHYKEV